MKTKSIIYILFGFIGLGLGAINPIIPLAVSIICLLQILHFLFNVERIQY